MKIVQLDSHIPWRGGEQQVLYLAQALPAHGYDNAIICQPHSILYKRACEAGLPTVALRMRHELDLVAAGRLGRYLRQQQVDVLHMHTPHAHTIGLLACLLAPHVRRVVSRRVDFAPIRHLFSRCKYAFPGVQYVAVSDAVRQVLLHSGIPRHRVQTVYSGVDSDRFTHVLEASPLFPVGTRVIGTVGHLAGHKGHSYLLQATQVLLRSEPRLGVVIAGTGALRATLEAQATDLGIAEQVCFTGFREDILSLIQSFEIFVFPSYLEGLGTSMLDAMALGKPVVATRAGGIPEVVQDGVTGLLVPPRDPAALAHALLYLLRHPEEGKKLGAAGQQRVHQDFTAEQMVRGTIQVYQQLMAS
jgi:glycosyltransferase involved in cell wall biosynthesis